MRAPVLLLALVMSLGACTSSEEPAEGKAPEGWSTTGPPTDDAEVTLGRDRLVNEVTDALPVDVPLGEFEVACEGDLAGIVGARQVCSVERQGRRTGVLVETVSVEGSEVYWEETYFLHAADLEAALPGRIRDRGGAVDAVDCPSSLPGEVGAQMTCTATGGTSEVALRVTGADGLVVDFDFEAR